MLTNGFQFFLQVMDQTGSPALHPAKIINTDNDTLIATSTAEALELVPGMDALIFFELKEEFVQQSIKLDVIMPNDEYEGEGAPIQFNPDEPEYCAVLGFTKVGEPISAENRQTHRVSTISANVVANISDDCGCEVLDISATGFSALSSQMLEEGSIIDTALTFEGNEYSGRTRIQNCIEHPSGQYRYGLHCLEEASAGSDLEEGCRDICMAVQRHQLRRMSGTG